LLAKFLSQHDAQARQRRYTYPARRVRVEQMLEDVELANQQRVDPHRRAPAISAMNCCPHRRI